MGVIIIRFENGILETVFAIIIKIFNKAIIGIIKILAIVIFIYEIKITTNPNIIQIAIMGAAKTLDNQNIIEI